MAITQINPVQFFSGKNKPGVADFRPRPRDPETGEELEETPPAVNQWPGAEEIDDGGDSASAEGAEQAAGDPEESAPIVAELDEEVVEEEEAEPELDAPAVPAD